VTVEGGGTYHANDVQRWLWASWEDATGCRWKPDRAGGHFVTMPDRQGWIRKLAKRRKCGLVVLGDAIEGLHHHSVEVIGADELLHERIAETILAPLAEFFDTTFVIRGTECHVGVRESALGLKLGARYDKATKCFCYEQLQLRIRDTLCHFKHHIGSSMRPWTSSMQFAAALSSEQLNAIGLEHKEVPRVICRAHRHQYGEFRNNQGLIVVSPPWQMLTRFARRVTQASLAQPGLFALDFRDLDSYGLPRVHAKLYRPDADEVVEL